MYGRSPWLKNVKRLENNFRLYSILYTSIAISDRQLRVVWNDVPIYRFGVGYFPRFQPFQILEITQYIFYNITIMSIVY